jgi:hypothetical protein
VGLIAAAKYKDSLAVVANARGRPRAGYSLLDRPFPDEAGALCPEGPFPEERRHLEGQAPRRDRPLEELLRTVSPPTSGRRRPT